MAQIIFTATSQLPTISCSSQAETVVCYRLPISFTSCRYRQLSGTILISSGKCQLYHSLILMVRVFTSLSSRSRRAIDWITGLSCLLTSSEILVLDTEWLKPSWALLSYSYVRPSFLRSKTRCALIPLQISWTTGLLRVCRPSSVEIVFASLGSDTPNTGFVFLPAWKCSSIDSSQGVSLAADIFNALSRAL